MDTLSSGVLVILALVAFNNYKNGTLPHWLRAKFFNQTPGDPAPAAGTPTVPQAYSGLGAGGALQAPVTGPVTSPFGPRPRDFHEGMDFGVPQGTPVHAARAGKVIAAGAAGGYGLKIDVDHGAAMVTRYAHLSRIDVHVADTVAAGATLGLSGSTGESTGPHLHFEVRLNGKAVDPAPYLSGAATLPVPVTA
jgi:murein DD-endopeptidase MepM/ murein hydrolase activator NlpD